MMILEPEHQDHTLHSLESRSSLVDHVLDRVGLQMENHQEDLGILVLVSVFRSILQSLV